MLYLQLPLVVSTLHDQAVHAVDAGTILLIMLPMCWAGGLLARLSLNAGDGTWLTDAAVLAIVRACPRLRQLALCSCTSVTDKALVAVAEGLPNLECLHCTGHDKCSGEGEAALCCAGKRGLCA